MKKVSLVVGLSALLCSSMVAKAEAQAGLIQCIGSFQKNPVGVAERWALETDIRTLSPEGFADDAKDVVLGTLFGNILSYETVYGTTGKAWNLREYTYAYYDGYMYLTEGKTYSAFTHFDDGASVAINGQYLYNGNQGYNKENWPSFKPYVATYTGWHKFQAMVFQGYGGIGKRNNISVVSGMQWTDVDPAIATNDLDNAEYWRTFVDPGDGSLFVTEIPTRNVQVVSWEKNVSAYNFSFKLASGNAAIVYACYGDEDYGTDLDAWPNKISLEVSSEEQVFNMSVPSDAKFVRFAVDVVFDVSWTSVYDLSQADASQIVSQSASVLDGDKVEVSANTYFADDATSAEVFVTYWIEGSDEKLTSAVQTLTKGEVFSCQLEGLVPDSNYNYTITISDDIGNQSTTTADSFKTLGASILISTSAARVDGRHFYITATVGSVGAGDTYLILYTSSTNLTSDAYDSRLVYEPVSIVKAETENTQYAFDDVMAKNWGDYYHYKVVCSNECAGVIWKSESLPLNADENSGRVVDSKSTYKWVKDLTYGYWTNSFNWSNTYKGDALGFPQYSSYADFTSFKGTAVTSIVTQTIGGTYTTNNWPITLNLSKSNLDVTFKGDYGTDELAPIDNDMYRMFIKNEVNLYENGKVTIDNVWFYKANGSFNFYKSATATNCMLHVTNAGVFDLPNDVFRANNTNSKLLFDSKSVGYFSTLELSSSGTELTIDDSTIYIWNYLYMNHWSLAKHTYDDGGVPRVIFKGKNPRLYMRGSLRIADDDNSDDSKLARPELVFEIPVGGYGEVPLQRYDNFNNSFLTSTSKTNILIKVDPESPAYTKPSKENKKYDHQLISWASPNKNPLTLDFIEFSDLPNPAVNYYYCTYDGTDAREGDNISGIWVHLEPSFATTIIIK
ncbi:MAG: hypothetical protein J6V41_08250 [Kiritimatiellae bacterium]|nr:hypothetical protein [Kiritimatiellia bacterium]